MAVGLPPDLAPSRTDLEAEYAASREHLRHLDGRVDAARTFGVGAVGAVLPLAIQQPLAVVALGGAALAHCFALLDLPTSFQSATFASRARKIELALDAYAEHARRKDQTAFD